MVPVVVRGVRSEDIDCLKRLYSDWFPLQYPEEFYSSLCSDSFMGSEPAVALVLETENTGEIVASAVAQRLSYALPQVHTVMDVLSNGNSSSYIAYVLTFGVRRDMRRQGLGRRLLRSLLDVYEKDAAVKAVVLHVLKSNIAALELYYSTGFVIVREIPDYYCIDGVMQPAILLALPLHGGDVLMRESPDQLESLHAPAVEADAEESIAIESQRRLLLRTALLLVSGVLITKFARRWP